MDDDSDELILIMIYRDNDANATYMYDGDDGAECCCIQAWKCRVGEEVALHQVLGEIVNVADVDAPRVPIIARTAGILFGMRHQRLVKPGDIMAKVAGNDPLPWRVGNLLTL